MNVITKIRRWYKSEKEELLWEIQFRGIFKGLRRWFYITFLEFSKIRDFYWFLKHKFIPKHQHHIIRTELEPNWHDSDTKILYSCFKILCDFVENEFDNVTWGSPEEELPDPTWKEWNEDQRKAGKEIKDLYHWWKNVYPKYDENSPLYGEKSDLLSWSFVPVEFDKDGDPTRSKLVFPEDTKERKLLFLEAEEYEKRCEQEIDDMLIRLIKVKKYMWT